MPPPPPPYPPSPPPLDRPHDVEPGWFANLEINIVGAHITNNLAGPVSTGGPIPDIVALPIAELDWTGSPRFEIGYRFCDGWGSFIFSYRFLVTEATATIVGFDLDGSDGFLKNRLAMNMIDFAYGSPEYHLGAQTDLQWRLGVRIANAFFDSDASGAFIEQHVSDLFWGAGPLGGIDLQHRFGHTGLGIFGRLNAGVAFGRITQSYNETLVAPDGTISGGATNFSGDQAVPMMDFQVGMSWTPIWRYHTTRLLLGYTWERWWSVGSIAGSTADITNQGLFFRGEFTF
jgi:hypothetical protein